MVVVDSAMDAGQIAAYYKDKTILVTGSTGFLGKILVEKVLRVQPEVRKIYLVVRAPDAASAKLRVETEVTGKELFSVLKEKHGKGFQSFTEEKICPLAGDIMSENFGMEASKLQELSTEIDIIVNGAATTNFYERYDVALDSNVMGVKHVCQFAKRCANLKMLLHVSTAYVAGEQEGLLPERVFRMGETLREGSHLDIDAELRLVRDVKKELEAKNSPEKTQKTTMRELGLKRARHFGWPNTYVFSKAMGEMLLGEMGGEIPVVIVRPSIITSIRRDPLPGWMEGTRTIDAVIIGYAKQNLSCFMADLDLIMDVIPGDMVVNAMMAAMAAHSLEKEARVVYHVGSSVRNPAPYAVLERSGLRYFADNPRVGKNGELIHATKIRFFKTLSSFHLFMLLKYKLPLEMLHVVNVVLCGLFSQRYNELNRKYKFVVHLVELYAPYVFFKGCFDDMNLERLRTVMMKNKAEAEVFNFDPKCIDWDDYFYNIHIPGVLKS